MSGVSKFLASHGLYSHNEQKITINPKVTEDPRHVAYQALSNLCEKIANVLAVSPNSSSRPSNEKGLQQVSEVKEIISANLDAPLENPSSSIKLT